jgi:hypothetical protein
MFEWGWYWVVGHRRRLCHFFYKCVQPIRISPVTALAVRRMAIKREAYREDVEPWIDNVIRDVEDSRRQATIVRFHPTLEGYVTLKPWEKKFS